MDQGTLDGPRSPVLWGGGRVILKFGCPVMFLWNKNELQVNGVCRTVIGERDNEILIDFQNNGKVSILVKNSKLPRPSYVGFSNIGNTLLLDHVFYPILWCHNIMVVV